MSNLLDKFEQGRRFLNYHFERLVSKTIARALLGDEVDGYGYKVSPPVMQAVTKAREKTGQKKHSAPVKKKSPEIETSLTLDYRKDAWGLERIVVDTVSNHLPADSSGTCLAVEYLQDGIWVDFRAADKEKPVDAIRMKDDGKGFDYRLLGLLYSTKIDEPTSVGQFGEGLKLVAAACLREGIAIEYRSRNWSARPFARDETIDGNILQKLCFTVKESLPPQEGSETVFHKPGERLLREVADLPNAVLAFNPQHRVLATEKYSLAVFGQKKPYRPKIIDLQNGKTALFVKGVRIKNSFGCSVYGDSDFDSLFSYDLGIDDLSPDRQRADGHKVQAEIKYLLEICQNREVYETILRAAFAEPERNFEEYHALAPSFQPPSRPFGEDFHISSLSLPIFDIKKYHDRESKIKNYSLGKFLDSRWTKSFHAVFGEKAVLESQNLEANCDAQALGYQVIHMNHLLAHYLRNVGIKTADALLKTEKEYQWVEREALTEDEKALLALIPDIHRVVLGSNLETHVRIYEGEYLVTRSADGQKLRVGQELITPDRGFYYLHDPENPEQGLIGIKRSTLKTRQDFMKTYIHELGHKVTGYGDYTREFTDFFVDALARLSVYFMERTAAE